MRKEQVRCYCLCYIVEQNFKYIDNKLKVNNINNNYFTVYVIINIIISGLKSEPLLSFGHAFHTLGKSLLLK